MAQQKYKVVLLGDSGVGKSSLIDRFVKGEIDSQNQVHMVPCSLLSASIFSAKTSLTTVIYILARKNI